jgi:hypothetical protein
MNSTSLCLLPLVALGLMANASPKRVVLLDEMANHVARQAQVVWDITNAAQDDDGKPVPSKVKPGDWVKLKQAGDGMSASLVRLQSRAPLIVRLPGQQTMDEKTTPGGLTPAKIQTYLDANPAGFRAMAKSFQSISRSISAAAQGHDLRKMNQIANDLDQACEACHQTYWYPEARR